MPIKIYKRGEIYHYRGTLSGRLLRGSTGTKDKTTAQRIVSNLEGQHWKGHLDGPAAVLTFAQAAILYRRARKSDRYLKAIEDYWKDTPVKDMTPGAIKQSCFTLEPTAGPATRNRHVIVPTQAVINHAAEAELCPHIRIRRFPVDRKEKIPATWEWVQAFVDSAMRPPANNPRVAALACFMFLTAARVSEAIALRWDDVDLTAAKALIRQTKVGAERRAHLQPELIVALANIPGERKGSVFGYAHPHNAKSQWAGAIRRAGIKKLSYHACRHGFATTLLQAGVDPITVAKRGGWRSPAHLFSTYGHAMDDETIVERLTGKINTRETHQDRKQRNIR